MRERVWNAPAAAQRAHSSSVVSSMKPQMSEPTIGTPNSAMLSTVTVAARRSAHVALLSPVQCAACAPCDANVERESTNLRKVEGSDRRCGVARLRDSLSPVRRTQLSRYVRRIGRRAPNKPPRCESSTR